MTDPLNHPFCPKVPLPEEGEVTEGNLVGFPLYVTQGRVAGGEPSEALGAAL